MKSPDGLRVFLNLQFIWHGMAQASSHVLSRQSMGGDSEASVPGQQLLFGAGVGVTAPAINMFGAIKVREVIGRPALRCSYQRREAAP
jgi:hypothetical protein